MEKVYVFLGDGFEEIEALTPVDVLRRGKVEVETVSVMGRRDVTGGRGITVTADRLFEDGPLDDACMYVLPGGKPGVDHLQAHGGLRALISGIAREKDVGRILAAICAAPSVLGQWGLLEGVTATCHPGFEELLTGARVTENTVEVCLPFITSRGMGTALPFALTLLSQLRDAGTVENVKKGIVWSGVF